MHVVHPPAPRPAPPETLTAATVAWHAGGRPWLRWAAAGLLGLLLTVPLLAVRIPLLVDYPNHLARMQVLATGAGTPALHAMFRITWAFIPNMAMDLLVPPLAHILPLTVAGKLFIAASILLPPAGTVALHRAWFGTRSWWPWTAVLAAVSAFLVYGFLNYLVAVGLALFGAAWHARRTGRGEPGGQALTVAGSAGWGVACLLSHIVGFGLLVLLMASTELGRGLRRGGAMRRLLPLLAAALVPLALYKAFGPAHSYTSAGTLGQAVWQVLHLGLLSEPGFRARWLLAGFTGQGTAIGAAAAALVVLPVAGAALRRRLLVAPGMWLAFLCLCAGYALLPAVLADNAMVYERLSLPLALVGIAGVQPVLPLVLLRALAVAVVALVGLRSAAMTRLWSEQAGLLAQVEAAIAPIPPGARVLAVRDGDSPWHTEADEPASHRILRRTVAYQHLPALVTLEREAFWPMIFTAAGKQPIALRPPYEQLAQSDGYMPLTRELAPAVTIPPPPGRCGMVAPEIPCQLWSWPQRYDYLLRFNAHDGPPPDPDHLREVRRDGWVILYRVQ